MPLSFVSIRYPETMGANMEVFFTCARCGGQTTQFWKPIVDDVDTRALPDAAQLPAGEDPSVLSDGLGGAGAPRARQHADYMHVLDCPTCDRMEGHEPPELQSEQHVKRPRKETFERLEWFDKRGVRCVLTVSEDSKWSRREVVELVSEQDGRNFRKFKQTIRGRLLLRRGDEGDNDAQLREFTAAELQLDQEQSFNSVDRVCLSGGGDSGDSSASAPATLVFQWCKFLAY